ncbi:hypothetical protein ABW19_dt0209517 [Dactylella cylindrospora]|nr:hypothetical protein ABW19_dt0209517 [Dactylella cylindrospora]
MHITNFLPILYLASSVSALPTRTGHQCRGDVGAGAATSKEVYRRQEVAGSAASGFEDPNNNGVQVAPSFDDRPKPGPVKIPGWMVEGVPVDGAPAESGVKDDGSGIKQEGTVEGIKGGTVDGIKPEGIQSGQEFGEKPPAPPVDTAAPEPQQGQDFGQKPPAPPIDNTAPVTEGILGGQGEPKPIFAPAPVIPVPSNEDAIKQLQEAIDNILNNIPVPDGGVKPVKKAKRQEGSGFSDSDVIIDGSDSDIKPQTGTGDMSTIQGQQGGSGGEMGSLQGQGQGQGGASNGNINQGANSPAPNGQSQSSLEDLLQSLKDIIENGSKEKRSRIDLSRIDLSRFDINTLEQLRRTFGQRSRKEKWPSTNGGSEEPTLDQATTEPSYFDQTTEVPYVEPAPVEQPSVDQTTTEQPSVDQTTEQPSIDETTEQTTFDQTAKQPSPDQSAGEIWYEAPAVLSTEPVVEKRFLSQKFTEEEIKSIKQAVASLNLLRLFGSNPPESQETGSPNTETTGQSTGDSDPAISKAKARRQVPTTVSSGQLQPQGQGTDIARLLEALKKFQSLDLPTLALSPTVANSDLSGIQRRDHDSQGETEDPEEDPEENPEGDSESRLIDDIPELISGDEVDFDIPPNPFVPPPRNLPGRDTSHLSKRFIGGLVRLIPVITRVASGFADDVISSGNNGNVDAANQALPVMNEFKDILTSFLPFAQGLGGSGDSGVVKRFVIGDFTEVLAQLQKIDAIGTHPHLLDIEPDTPEPTFVPAKRSVSSASTVKRSWFSQILDGINKIKPMLPEFIPDQQPPAPEAPAQTDTPMFNRPVENPTDPNTATQETTPNTSTENPTEPNTTGENLFANVKDKILEHLHSIFPRDELATVEEMTRELTSSLARLEAALKAKQGDGIVTRDAESAQALEKRTPQDIPHFQICGIRLGPFDCARKRSDSVEARDVSPTASLLRRGLIRGMSRRSLSDDMKTAIDKLNEAIKKDEQVSHPQGDSNKARRDEQNKMTSWMTILRNPFEYLNGGSTKKV